MSRHRKSVPRAKGYLVTGAVVLIAVRMVLPRSGSEPLGSVQLWFNSAGQGHGSGQVQPCALGVSGGNGAAWYETAASTTLHIEGEDGP
jgi:hypothetical protein